MKYERYERQTKLSFWGKKEQKRLEKAKVLVAGIGGLGCYVSLALVSAGVGYLRLVDYDVVELSNLNRQILFRESDLGKSKVKVAVNALKLYNSEAEIKGIEEKITEKNVLELTQGMDVVIDCLDNFESRYLLNKACIDQEIPLVHGALYGFEGRVAFFIPKKTPCLRCIYPHEPRVSKEPSPALSTTCGVIASIQANEAIKYLTKIGKVLINKLLIYDGETLGFKFIDIKKRKKCKECGKRLFSQS